MNLLLVPGILVAVVAALRGMWSPCGLSMISSITPMAERAKGHRFGVTATWFTLGGLAGGTTLGAGMAAGAWLVSASGLGATATVTVFSALALVTVASDLKPFGFSLPIHPRQVNETWLQRLRPWAYASGFGWQIGSGFATYIMTGAVYLTVAAGVLSADPLLAFGLGIVFGTLRGLCVFVAVRADGPAELRRLHATIDRLAAVSLDAAIAGQILALVALAVIGGRLPVLVVAVAATIGSITVRLHRNRAVAGAIDPPAAITRRVPS